MAGFEVPPDTSILAAEIGGIGKEHPLSAEKLSPVLSLYFVEGLRQPVRMRAKPFCGSGGWAIPA